MHPNHVRREATAKKQEIIWRDIPYTSAGLQHHRVANGYEVTATIIQSNACLDPPSELRDFLPFWLVINYDFGCLLIIYVIITKGMTTLLEY